MIARVWRGAVAQSDGDAYPDDDRYLVERDEVVARFEIVAHVLP